MKNYSSAQHASVLILALWVVAALAGLVLVFSRSARIELDSAANRVSAAHADAVERAAEAYALSIVEQEADEVVFLAETWFQGVRVGDGHAWFLRPLHGEVGEPFFGIVDESSKLNLNTASSETLSRLPGWTAELAASVVDWRDTDSEPGTGGAEDSYYLSLPEPYRAKNANFECVEELLLVSGASRELLFGLDPNARKSPWTWGSGAGASSLVTDLATARGTYDLLTVWSTEAAATGQQVNVNDQNRDQLVALLREALGESRGNEVVARTRPTPPFRDIFDFAVRGGLKSDELEKVYDRLTATSGARGGQAGAATGARGRINVRTAPREVLACLSGLSESDVDSIIAERRGIVEPTTPAWLLDVLRERAVGLGDLITAQASQFSTEIVAVSGDGRAFRRVRIVIDASASPPRLVFRRDVSDLGWPFGEVAWQAIRDGSTVPPGLFPAGGAQ